MLFLTCDVELSDEQREKIRQEVKDMTGEDCVFWDGKSFAGQKIKVRREADPAEVLKEKIEQGKSTINQARAECRLSSVKDGESYYARYTRMEGKRTVTAKINLDEGEEFVEELRKAISAVRLLREEVRAAEASVERLSKATRRVEGLRRQF